MAVRRAHMRALEGRKGGSARSLAAHFLGGAALALMLFTALADPAEAGGTLTVGMTAGDIPVTTGNPDQGFEGYRFVGYNLYDAGPACVVGWGGQEKAETTYQCLCELRPGEPCVGPPKEER